MLNARNVYEPEITQRCLDSFGEVLRARPAARWHRRRLPSQILEVRLDSLIVRNTTSEQATQIVTYQ
jgi:hypothetical protein